MRHSANNTSRLPTPYEMPTEGGEFYPTHLARTKAIQSFRVFQHNGSEAQISPGSLCPLWQNIPSDLAPCALHFHQLIIATPLTIIAALMTMRKVTRSTSRKNSAVRIKEKSGPVLAIGITTDTLPRSSA